MSWMNLVDSALASAVKVEEIKGQVSAIKGSQQKTASQPQAPQVIPTQGAVNAAPPKDNKKMLLIGGGGVALLIVALLVLRK